MNYLLRRTAHALLLLAGVSVLTFIFASLAPGEFFDEMKLNPQISRETVEHLRSEYGLDRPLPVRYWRWVGSALRGEFGVSFAYNAPVAPLLRVRARNTLLLTIPAMLIAWLLAVPLGAWSAARRRSAGDRFVSLAATLLLAIPELVLAIAFLALAVWTRWLPAGGMVSVDFDRLGAFGKVADYSRHLLLPAAALALGIFPIIFRHVRSAVEESLGAPFITAARAHGIPERRIVFLYALPAAASPVISLFGFSLGTLLSAALLTEVVMSWPGLGPLLLEAILGRDVYVVVGAVFFSTIFLVAGNYLADVLLYTADPRIRAE